MSAPARGGLLAGTVLAAAGVVAWRRRQAAARSRPNFTGAPVPLESRARRASGVGSATRVLSPPWEPRALAALAEWEPTPPQGRVGRAVAYLWASPVTAVGLVAGLAAGVAPVRRGGVFVFANAGGITGAVLRGCGFDAGAFGHVVVAAGHPDDELMAHERAHGRQAERLGPLMGPVYLGLLAVYGYARHPLERAARRAVRYAAGAPP
ncbi:MAG TPA: hypothetical protein VG452_01020 [Egibacteraceae bacterium]|nr:hypothetical protein [Egibacteraceae bacterium]